jgi:hypothetical protein
MQQGSLCPKCGTQNAAGQGFCAACGASLQQSCPNCNSMVDISARFCPSCGAGLGWGIRVKDIQYQITATENGLKGLITQSSNDIQSHLSQTEDGLKAMLGQYSEHYLSQQVAMNETTRHIAGLIAEEHSMSLGKKIMQIGSGIIALGLAAIGLSYVWKDIPYLPIGGAIVVAVGFLMQLISNFITVRHSS